MTTPRTRAIVSLVGSLSVTIVLAACAGSAARSASNSAPAMAPVAPVLLFDNDARDYAHVYLVSDRRQWYLGRVEAGARRTLRIPDEAIVTSPDRLQLGVMIGQSLTPRIAGEPQAMFTIAQPARSLLSQDWGLAQGQLISAPIRVGAGSVREIR